MISLKVSIIPMFSDDKTEIQRKQNIIQNVI